ncbi:MADS-box protein ZMM17-like [Hibiscus syriacus]|uniref:MADS-box protein ZMM17-like n=1 Tax=Hibiscus syriacus TaxID=106335 RepID=A0A6A3CLY5_HIBSY|nr:MADS-box protein ZMM17-like [Hibiscus syriacus]
MGPQELYWQTNTSFSPPPSRWDFHFQPDGLSYGSYDGNQLYESSTSPNSKESRGWVRRNLLYNHQYSASDGAGPFLSSPSDLSQDHVGGQSPFTCIVEGTSTNADSGVSTSPYSDSSESEPMVEQCFSSQRNISSRYCFMSKPIHPLSFPMETPTTEASDSTVAGLSDDTATPQRDAHCWSSASSSNDIADISESFESVMFSRSCIPSSGFKCSLCERYLSQRSPWSARRIVSSDMPVAGALSCGHTFHAECLKQTNTKNSNSISRLKPFSENGPSKSWSCAQVGDCVQGVLQPPPRNRTMLLLNQSHMKKNLFMKVNSSREFPGKLRKSGSSPLQLFSGKSIYLGAVVCSKTIAGPSMKS